MNTHKAFWQMITFSPWLYTLNVLLQLAVIIMMTINPLITLVVFVPLVGSSVLMNRMSARIQQYHHESRKAAGEVSSFIGEIFNTTQAIQLANAQHRVIAHLRQLNDARRHTKLQCRNRTHELACTHHQRKERMQ